MSDFLFYGTLILLSIIFYLPARWAKIAFSGEHFTTAKFWTAIAYNFLWGYVHLQFSMLGTLPFYGQADNSIIDLFSFIMAIMHAAALPAPWKRTLLLSSLKGRKK